MNVYMDDDSLNPIIDMLTKEFLNENARSHKESLAIQTNLAKLCSKIGTLDDPSKWLNFRTRFENNLISAGWSQYLAFEIADLARLRTEYDDTGGKNGADSTANDDPNHCTSKSTPPLDGNGPKSESHLKDFDTNLLTAWIRESQMLYSLMIGLLGDKYMLLTRKSSVNGSPFQLWKALRNTFNYDCATQKKQIKNDINGLKLNNGESLEIMSDRLMVLHTKLQELGEDMPQPTLCDAFMNALPNTVKWTTFKSARSAYGLYNNKTKTELLDELIQTAVTHDKETKDLNNRDNDSAYFNQNFYNNNRNNNNNNYNRNNRNNNYNRNNNNNQNSNFNNNGRNNNNNNQNHNNNNNYRNNNNNNQGHNNNNNNRNNNNNSQNNNNNNYNRNNNNNSQNYFNPGNNNNNGNDNNNNNGNNNGNGNKRGPRCWKCNEFGHTRNECTASNNNN